MRETIATLLAAELSGLAAEWGTTISAEMIELPGHRPRWGIMH